MTNNPKGCFAQTANVSKTGGTSGPPTLGPPTVVSLSRRPLSLPKEGETFPHKRIRFGDSEKPRRVNSLSYSKVFATDACIELRPQNSKTYLRRSQGFKERCHCLDVNVVVKQRSLIFFESNRNKNFRLPDSPPLANAFHLRHELLPATDRSQHELLFKSVRANASHSTLIDDPRFSNASCSTRHF